MILQPILQGRFFSARKFYFQNFLVNRRFAFDDLRPLWFAAGGARPAQRQTTRAHVRCEDNCFVVYDSHSSNSFTVPIAPVAGLAFASAW
jgi:hypothetical protein